jgi:phospholipid/cholesterol/gamma-HCH transport system permease protein
MYGEKLCLPGRVSRGHLFTMKASDQPESALVSDLRAQPGGVVTLTLHGRLDLQSTAACWRELEARLRPLHPTSVEVEASQLEAAGLIGVALLRYLKEGGMSPGANVAIRGLNPELRKLLDSFTSEDFRAARPPARKKSKLSQLPEELGSGVRGLWKDLREQIAFIGSVAAALPAALVHPRRMRWSEILRIGEAAGANALPVVGLFSFLVGLVLALEAAKPLAQFGAQIFIADMVGFASIRDTGPMVTAIMLAGRSGSAFAAELGSMKVNGELDALTTMGLEPVRFLVVQRVLAALLLTPLLTLYAMLLSIVGGLLILRFQGFPPLMIYHQIVARVHLNDLGVGLGKSLVFGLLVGGIGCLRGLQTGQGPQAVGVSTTRSVVAGIVLIILADTLFSTVQYFLK